jgi:predicted N-acetyltransferase YhbS
MIATTEVTIRVAAAADLAQVTAILAAAFHDGDLAPWLVPSDGARPRIYRRYFTILAEHALTHGHVELIDDIAVAIWYDLCAQPQADIPDYDRRLTKAVGRRYLPRFVALDMAMHDHHTALPHHYLGHLAVHPDQQGQGYGGLLLRHRLGKLDAAGMPSYLEATGTRNATLYRRYGYTSQPPYAVDGDPSPLLYPMWRDPHPPSPRPAAGTLPKTP